MKKWKPDDSMRKARIQLEPMLWWWRHRSKVQFAIAADCQGFNNAEMETLSHSDLIKTEMHSCKWCGCMSCRSGSELGEAIHSPTGQFPQISLKESIQPVTDCGWWYSNIISDVHDSIANKKEEKNNTFETLNTGALIMDIHQQRTQWSPDRPRRGHTISMTLVESEKWNVLIFHNLISSSITDGQSENSRVLIPSLSKYSNMENLSHHHMQMKKKKKKRRWAE